MLQICSRYGCWCWKQTGVCFCCDHRKCVMYWMCLCSDSQLDWDEWCWKSENQLFSCQFWCSHLQGCKHNYWDTCSTGMFPNHFRLCCWLCSHTFVMEVFILPMLRSTRENTGVCCSNNLHNNCLSCCAWIFLFCCWRLRSLTVSMVINYHESRPASRLWCVLAVDVFPLSEQCSSQVLGDKALLCSLSGDGTISSLLASVPLFFSPFALVLALLVLAVYVILLITLWEFAFLCWLLENTLTSDFWLFGWYHDLAPWWTHPDFMSSLHSNEADDPVVVFFFFWANYQKQTEASLLHIFIFWRSHAVGSLMYKVSPEYLHSHKVILQIRSYFWRKL